MVEIDLTHFRDKNNLTKLFARILKENRAFIPYIRNLKEQNKHNLNSLLRDYYFHGFKNNFVLAWNHGCISYGQLDVLSEVLTHSFIWERTPEGDAFWRNIYVKLKSQSHRELPKTMAYKSLKNFLNMSK